ncbi:cytochrome P450 [Streptomyces sp. NPDC048191]|uniref:cytochrome P450 n=1 Tax=Streptomyces sp. NPDC048191 TaxID=3155484 RepID=UPI0033CA1AB2
MTDTTTQTGLSGPDLPHSKAVCPFPLPRAHPLDPPPQFAGLRDQGPVAPVELWDGSRAWLVTRYEEARTVLADRRFSSDVTRPGFPTYYEGQRAVVELAPSFIRTDPPEHSRLRRMLTRDFMLRQVESLRPAVRHTVDSLVKDVRAADGPVDLIKSLALPVPSLTVCQLLGIPYEDHEIFQELTNVNLSRNSTREQTETATNDLLTWLDDLVTAQEREPGEGLLGRLVVDQVGPGNLSHDDLVAMARLLVVAGHETTANMLGMTLLTYMQQPRTFDGVDTDPAKLKSAVEELLRYHSIIQIGLARVTTERVRIGDTWIGPGEGVIVSLLAANRDERAFATPDAFVVDRPATPKHIAFGFGVHQCIGQALARLEVQELLLGVVRQLPGLRPLADIGDMPFRGEMTVHGVHELWATV